MAKVVDPKEEWFWDEKIVDSYESWYEGKGKRADKLEKKLLAFLLERFGSVESLVEVGCGTTHFTRYFESLGLTCTGYDLSPIMLDAARNYWAGDLVRGDSAHLPFGNNSFDLVALITCLEFMPRPLEVLREAGRVANQGIILGLMNRYGISTIRRIVQVRFGRNPFYRHAHFYSLREIMSLLEQALGHGWEAEWRATVLPRPLGDRMTKIAFGDFLGLGAKLNKPKPDNARRVETPLRTLSRSRP